MDIKQRVLAIPRKDATPHEKQMYYNAEVHVEMCRRAIKNMLDRLLIDFQVATTARIVSQEDVEIIGTSLDHEINEGLDTDSDRRREELTDHFLTCKTWPAPHVVEGGLFRAARLRALSEKKWVENERLESEEWVENDRMESKESEWVEL